MKAADWIASGYQDLQTAMSNGCLLKKIVIPLQLEADFMRATLEGKPEVCFKTINHKVVPELCGVPVRFDGRLKKTLLYVLESIEKIDPFKDPGGGRPTAGEPAVLAEQKVA